MDDNELDDGRITYYYSREERLKKAPHLAQGINNSSNAPKSGLFRIFTSNKSLGIPFFSIIVICIIIIIVSRLTIAGNTSVLGNNTVSISAASAGNSTYITIKKTVAHGRKQKNAEPVEPYFGEVNIGITLPNDKDSVYFERINFDKKAEEVFNILVPFRGKRLLVLMEADTEQTSFNVIPK